MKKILLLLCLLPLYVEASIPSTVLWVWEARQDLRSLNPEHVGVAIYVGTVTLNRSGIITTVSRQKMAFPPKIYRMAVIHLSVSPHAHPVLDHTAVERVVDAIMELAGQAGIQDLQLDFSATQSQKIFYANIIRGVRARLPKQSILSITALANWCVGDRWMAKNHLPVDLVVPMYFSLSPIEWQKNNFINHFPGDIKKLAPECQRAIGLATFERWQVPLRAQVPVFVFTRGTWTPELIEQALKLTRMIHS